jgi:hypothetical protein
MTRCRISILTSFTVLLLLLVPCGRAQDQSERISTKGAGEASEQGNTYRLDFTLSEMENQKTINTRNYFLMAQSGIKSSLKMGKKVPLETGATGNQIQIQYLDIGANIDCKVQEIQQGLLLDLAADFSNIAADQTKGPGLVNDPVISRIGTELKTMIIPGKPAVISRLDDPSSMRTFQLEVTATRVH